KGFIRANGLCEAVRTWSEGTRLRRGVVRLARRKLEAPPLLGGVGHRNNQMLRSAGCVCQPVRKRDFDAARATSRRMTISAVPNSPGTPVTPAGGPSA